MMGVQISYGLTFMLTEPRPVARINGFSLVTLNIDHATSVPPR